MRKYIQYISTPTTRIKATDFVAKYGEAFSTPYVGGYELNKGYKFDGWHMLIPDGIVLMDVDGIALTFFSPVVTHRTEDTKYFFSYGHGAVVLTDQIAEDNFHGYHKYPKDAKITLASYNKEKMSFYKTTIQYGENLAPI